MRPSVIRVDGIDLGAEGAGEGHALGRPPPLDQKLRSGEEGGRYQRLLPRPGGGSVIVATISIVPTSDPERTGVILSDELARIAAPVAHADRFPPREDRS